MKVRAFCFIIKPRKSYFASFRASANCRRNSVDHRWYLKVLQNESKDSLRHSEVSIKHSEVSIKHSEVSIKHSEGLNKHSEDLFRLILAHLNDITLDLMCFFKVLDIFKFFFSQ